MGADFICVDRIDYIAGYKFFLQYKKVRKHMNMRMEEEDETGHEKYTVSDDAGNDIADAADSEGMT